MANKDPRAEQPKTSAILTTPSADTTVITRTYSDEEVEKIKALREVNLLLLGVAPSESRRLPGSTQTR